MRSVDSRDRTILPDLFIPTPSAELRIRAFETYPVTHYPPASIEVAFDQVPMDMDIEAYLEVCKATNIVPYSLNVYEFNPEIDIFTLKHSLHQPPQDLSPRQQDKNLAKRIKAMQTDLSLQRSVPSTVFFAIKGQDAYNVFMDKHFSALHDSTTLRHADILVTPQYFGPRVIISPDEIGVIEHPGVSFDSAPARYQIKNWFSQLQSVI